MAIKNLQNRVGCVANIHGGRVTGTESKESMWAGSFQAPQSLPRLPLLGIYPIPTRPFAKLAGDAATAMAVRWTGRSAGGSGTILSKRS